MDYEKKIREYLNNGNVDELYKSMLLNLFPELKESDDERIRKSLCKAIWTYIPTEEGQEYIAWLERQGEQKPADVRTTGYWHVEDAMKEVEEKAEAFTNAHQGENADEILAQMRGEKNSTWSEEDETVLNNLIYALANDRIGNDRDEYITWLKSLKPQSKLKPGEEHIDYGTDRKEETA